MANSNWKTAIYHQSPVFFQNLMASLYGWQKNRQRFGVAAAREWSVFYEESKTWSESQLKEYQWAELKRTLRHAESTSPYYQAQFRRLGLTADEICCPDDMAKLPFTTKNDLAKHGKEIVSREFDVETVPKHPTSGSTGMPINLYCDRASMARNFAFRWAECRLDIPRRTRYAHFTGLDLVRPEQQRPPFWRMNYANNQRLYSVFHMNDRTMPAYIQDLNRFAPVWIYGYPSALFNLAEFMQRSGLRLKCTLRGIVTSSEQCIPERRAKIEEMFDTKVWDEYGQAELVCTAFQCECGKLHEKRNFSFVEFVPTGEKEDGLDVCEIVGTSTINRAWPLLRYRTGDIALIDKNATCPHGRPGRIIERVYGRTSQFLLLKDGTRIASIGPIVTRCRHTKSVQAIQHQPGAITLRVVPTEQYDKVKDEELLLRQFRSRLGDTSKVDIELEYSDAPMLSSSGKFLMVISKRPT